VIKGEINASRVLRDGRLEYDTGVLRIIDFEN
jgi:hypothetical protein